SVFRDLKPEGGVRPWFEFEAAAGIGRPETLEFVGLNRDRVAQESALSVLLKIDAALADAIDSTERGPAHIDDLRLASGGKGQGQQCGQDHEGNSPKASTRISIERD